MMTRRQLFGRAALGLGTAALADIIGPDLLANSAGQAGGTHFAPKAKRVIYLFMSGGPSHHDLWSHKPKMREMFGKDLPEHVRDGQRITGMTAGQKTLPVCPSKYKYTRHDNNDQGVWVSELLPHTAQGGEGALRRAQHLSPRRSTTTRRSRTSRPAARFPAGPASAPGSATGWVA